MSGFDNAYRHLQNIFLPTIDFLEQGADKEQEDANFRIYTSVNLALRGQIDLDELIEEIENDILYGDIDNYLDEVERDLGLWWNEWQTNGQIFLPQTCTLIEMG